MQFDLARSVGQKSVILKAVKAATGSYLMTATLLLDGLD